MSESMQDRQHYLFAVLLGIAGLLIILIFVTIRSQADDSTSTTSISNTTATVNTITVATASLGTDTSSINPSESSWTNVYVHGTYTDNNGCDEVSSGGVTTTVFYTSVGANCDQSEVDCYKKTSYSASCSISSCSGGTDETGVYECTIPIFYFATNGGWTASVVLNDGTGNSAAVTDTFTFTELTAISAPANMNFGNVAYNGTSGTSTAAASYSVVNSGNDNATLVKWYGGDLTCTDGTIDVSKIRVTSSTSGCNTYSGMLSLSTASTALGVSIQKGTASTTGGQGSTTLCARINAVPESGSVLSGSCTGSATFLAY